MPAPIRLVVRFTPFPPGFVGDLSKFCQAFIDRIEVLSPFAGLQWQIGGIKPTSNVGPWLNDLGQPFVWDETLKDYIPMDISLSLGDIDARVTALEDAGYDTPAARDAAIAAAVGGIAVPSVTAYPAAASKVNQTIDADAFNHLMLMTRYVDPNNAFDDANNRYTVPVSGVYRISAQAQVDNGTADASAMEIGIQINRNGIFALAHGVSAATPPGLRWYPTLHGLVSLSAGDFITALMSANDDVGTGNVVVSSFDFGIELVQKA
jgi:hypothetical protein